MAVAGAAVGLASILGGLFGGSKERPTLDPEQLKQLFGPQAIGDETQQLFKLLQNSPMFSQLMQQGALAGSQTANRTRANLAGRGISGSPIGAFLNASASGSAGAFQRNSQAQLFSQALQAALQNVGNRQQLFAQSQLGQQSQPTFGRMIGSSLLSGGANLLSGQLQPSQQAQSPFDAQAATRQIQQLGTFGGGR